MFWNAKNASLNLDGTKMDYAVFGSGDRALVVIPGLSTRGVKGATLSLAYMYRIFAKDYRVFVFDRKEAIPEGYTVRDIAADVARGMETLNLRCADVIGISQGGMVAQYLAVDYPHLVHKLVLGVTLARENETVRTAISNWIGWIESGDYGAFTRDMFEKMYSEVYIRKYRWLFPLLSRLAKPKDVRRFVILAQACLTCTTYDELERIRCPVFVIGGQKDQVVTGRASEEIADKLECPIYMYADYGHAAYDEAGDFNSRILAFLSEES